MDASTPKNELENEFNYYIEHQDELVKKYNGKFLVIVNKNIFGAFDSTLDAYNNAITKYEAGTFLIQRCSPGNSDYTQTFHSRVSFA